VTIFFEARFWLIVLVVLFLCFAAVLFGAVSAVVDMVPTPTRIFLGL